MAISHGCYCPCHDDMVLIVVDDDINLYNNKILTKVNVFSEETSFSSFMFFPCFRGGSALILLCEIDLSPKCEIGAYKIAQRGIL